MPSLQQRLKITLRPELLSFSGHETFPFRYGWLKKGVDATSPEGGNPRVFNDADSIVTLGVGKNMVRSIRHWGLATGVLEEEPGSRGAKVMPSELGSLLFADGGSDQFTEDPNTLWVMHWNLLCNPQRCTTWQLAFSAIPSNEFTRDQLLQVIEMEAKRHQQKSLPSRNSINRDIDVFLRTYIAGKQQRGMTVEDSLDCPLVELQLLTEVGNSGVYQIRRGPKNTLADHIFTFALVDFWDRTAPQRETLAFPDIAYGRRSPGIAFKLDENSLVERLERLEDVTSGDLLYTETAGLKQVYRKTLRPKLEYLNSYYQQNN